MVIEIGTVSPCFTATFISRKFVATRRHVMSTSFVFFVLVGLLIFGLQGYFLLFNPKYRDRIIRLAQTPLAPWTQKPGGREGLMIIVFVLFLFFLCMSCRILYQLIANT